MLIKLSGERGERYINPAHICTVESEPYPASAYVWSVRMVSGDVVKLTRGQFEELMEWCRVGSKPVQRLEFADAIGGE